MNKNKELMKALIQKLGVKESHGIIEGAHLLKQKERVLISGLAERLKVVSH